MDAKLLTADRFVDMRTGIMYRYVHSETEYFRPHYHDYCEVFEVLEGAAQHKDAGAGSQLRQHLRGHHGEPGPKGKQLFRLAQGHLAAPHDQPPLSAQFHKKWKIAHKPPHFSFGG